MTPKRVYIAAVLAVLFCSGCKAVHETEFDEAGNVVREYSDTSFTLGGSEGDGKTLLGISIGNGSANDEWGK